MQKYQSKNSKPADPRLQAREAYFQRLHLSVYETMNYARAIQHEVESTGHDIEPDNQDYQQLLRDYQVTKNLSPINDSKLEPMCYETDDLISKGDQACANYAQLCAAATSALNHWRILAEIPEDLRSNESITKTLKDKFHHYEQTWQFILGDLQADF